MIRPNVEKPFTTLAEVTAAVAQAEEADTICMVDFDSGTVWVPETPFQYALDFDSEEPLKGGYCGTDGTCESCQ